MCRKRRNASSYQLWSWAEIWASLWRISKNCYGSYVSVCKPFIIFLISHVKILQYLHKLILFSFLIVWLISSDVDKGGETVFPEAKGIKSKKGVSVRPKKGDALLFWSMRPDGSRDPSSKHGKRHCLSLNLF